MTLLQRAAGLSAGFTLIELSVVLALSAVLVVLAIPNFQAMVAKRKVQHASQALIEDLRFARAEAIKRSRRVEVCKSNDGLSCNAAPAGDWAGGWVVMLGTETLRVQMPQQGLQSSSTLATVGYEATGLADRKAGSVTFEAVAASDLVQRVCVSLQGRARLAPFGATAC